MKRKNMTKDNSVSSEEIPSVESEEKAKVSFSDLGLNDEIIEN